MNGKADLYQKGPRMYHPSAMSSGNSTYRYINTFSPLRWQVKPWGDTSDVILLSGSRGGGKLLDVNTPIPTPQGFKNMGDIEAGDLVLDETGKPTRVVAVSSVEYPRKAYRITFDDKSTVVAGSDHKWITWDRSAESSWSQYNKGVPFPENWASWDSSMSSDYLISDAEIHRMIELRDTGLTYEEIGKIVGKTKSATFHNLRKRDNSFYRPGPAVRTTEEIISTLRRHGRPNHTIPLPGSSEFREVNLGIDPWVMGYLLGDGNTNGRGIVSCHSEDVDELMARFSAAGYPASKTNVRTRFYASGIRADWEKYGLHKGKFVPEDYLFSSALQRVEIVRGLIDSDGTVSRGKYIFDNTNESLVDGLRTILASLGIKAYKYHIKPSKKNHKHTWRLGIPSPIELASLKRKAGRGKHEWSRRQLSRRIVSIEEVENRPMKCIQVENESHLYLCTKDFIPTHNSRLCGERLHAFCLKYPNAVCQVMRKTKSSLKKSVIHNLVRKVIGDDPRVIHHESDGMFMYDNGSVLYYDGMTDPSARERLKSREPDMVWLEEAKDFDEEDFNEIRALVRGTAAPWRQIMLSTNPDGPLHWINRRLILGGEARVYYSGAKDNPHLPPEYIANLESLTGVQYQRDVLGLWVAGTGQIFDTWVDDPLGEDTNVTELADIIPHGGDILWFIDDGYSGTLDPSSGLYTANSHPRAMLLVQRRQDGILAVADESYAVEVLASNHIAEMLTKWPRPYMIVRDRAAASLDGACRENGIRNIVYNTMNVDESIKEMRTWLAADANGVRKVIAHPRCKMLRYEMAQYSTDNEGRVIKQHDNGVDSLRYGIWNEAYGRGRKVDIVSWKNIADRMEHAHA